MTVVEGLLATWPGRALVVVLVGAIGAGAVIVSGATAAPAKVEYRTSPVTRGSVTQTVAVSGSINSAGQVRLNFKNGGRLAEVYVTVGQQVAAGQPLAKLETTDLATSVTSAQVNVQTAQARYQQVVGGADTQDVASAQQSLLRIQSAYTSQKSVWQSSSSGARSDAASVIGVLDPLQTMLQRALNDLQTVAVPTPAPSTPTPTPRPTGAPATPIPTPNTSTTDARTAYNAVSQAQLQIQNAQANGVDQLWQAINDYTNATLSVTAAIASFDSAVASGSDTNAASGQYQTAQASYASAASRLTAMIDSINGQASGAVQSISTAQSALNNGGSKYDTNLDAACADLATALAMASGAQLNASSAKTKLSQGDRSLSTVTDTITGSYVNAVNSLAKVSATPKPADVVSASASVTSAQLQLDSALNNLANATLTAPTAGAVSAINGQVGEIVGSSSTAGFIVMAATGAIALHGTVGEADVAKIKLGQVANVTVDALGTGTRMTGKVTSVDPVATIQQGVPVYGVDVTIDVPTSGVRPGMSSTAQVILASKTNVLTVPNLAIRSQAGRRYVQLLVDGQPVDTDATFGLATDTVTEVTAGLKEGDLVVLPQPRGGTSAQPRVGGPGQPGQVQFR